jgi:coproporphyrinogen III oxidase
LPENKNIEGKPFIATGISSVIHPYNPYIPTAHFNVRFFLSENKVWWFGGGFDLTPFYPYKKDCVHWHKTSKYLCDKYHKDIYLKYKNWADKYFYLNHRKESRGIGGIFFDYLNMWDYRKCFNFIQDVGNSFIKAYVPILNNRKSSSFSKKNKIFQLYRRGRYVEFNLIYDRGTLFGLQSNGRIESILMSLPPKVIWNYNYYPSKTEIERNLYSSYLIPKNWI